MAKMLGWEDGVAASTATGAAVVGVAGACGSGGSHREDSSRVERRRSMASSRAFNSSSWGKSSPGGMNVHLNPMPPYPAAQVPRFAPRCCPLCVAATVPRREAPEMLLAALRFVTPAPGVIEIDESTSRYTVDETAAMTDGTGGCEDGHSRWEACCGAGWMRQGRIDIATRVLNASCVAIRGEK